MRAMGREGGGVGDATTATREDDTHPGERSGGGNISVMSTMGASAALYPAGRPSGLVTVVQHDSLVWERRT